MIRKLKNHTKQLTHWEKRESGLDSVTALLTKGTWRIKTQTNKRFGYTEYAVFINYEAYQLTNSPAAIFRKRNSMGLMGHKPEVPA